MYMHTHIRKRHPYPCMLVGDLPRPLHGLYGDLATWSMYIYIYIYMYTHIITCIYIYIYIREFATISPNIHSKETSMFTPLARYVCFMLKSNQALFS